MAIRGISRSKRKDFTSARGSRKNILIREGRWLEGAARVDTCPYPNRSASIRARVRWNPLETIRISSYAGSRDRDSSSAAE